MAHCNVSRRRALMFGLAAAAMPLAATAQTMDIGGTYQVDGRNPDGSAYSGSVVIATGFGSDMSVNWTVGSQSYTGKGVMDGRVLTVDWGDSFPVVYVVMPSGDLHGTWANGRALELLTAMP